MAVVDAPAAQALRLSRRRRDMVALVIGALLIAAAVVGAGRVARTRAIEDLGDRAAALLPLASTALTGVIDKQRLIPLVLARDPEVIALLAAPTPEAEQRLDEKLAAIAAEAGAAVIYLVGPDGVSVAASNAGAPDSFVGSNYGFRSYFSEAMARGSAEQFALGTVSGRPGLYLSRRVDSVLGPLGVVVVKVEFDALEERWRESGSVVHVTDAEGIVLATTEPEWRFGATRPLADAAAARAARQLPEGEPFATVPVERGNDGLDQVSRGRATGSYASAAAPVGASEPAWTLTLMTPAGSTPAKAMRTAQLTVLLAGLLVAALTALALRRRRGARTRQEALAAMNAELERRVAAEIAERESAETRVRRMRDELAQANRLSILGQIAAGVAHEINQPVAAIRTYAESGMQLLDGGETGETRDNLKAIVGVTDRIGAITQMLRGFSRRGTGGVGPVPVEEAIDGALALLAGRIRDAGAMIDRRPRLPGAAVLAGRIRLEQILVNLLQNALDAVRGVAEPLIRISVLATGSEVRITVRDNGPGLDGQARETLFMPFATTKEKGLGLGLVISGDLAREFGGELRFDAAVTDGASFTLVLPRAPR